VFAWKFILLAFPMSAESYAIKARGMYLVLINHFKKLLKVGIHVTHTIPCLLCVLYGINL
jgi:hypothetical protein